MVRRIFDNYNINDEYDDIVAECIAEFAKIDPNSFNFRYPVDTKGIPIPLSIERLDPIQLCKVMDGIEGYIIGSLDYLDAQRRA
jgi:hypothetical protein